MEHDRSPSLGHTAISTANKVSRAYQMTEEPKMKAAVNKIGGGFVPTKGRGEQSQRSRTGYERHAANEGPKDKAGYPVPDCRHGPRSSVGSVPGHGKTLVRGSSCLCDRKKPRRH